MASTPESTLVWMAIIRLSLWRSLMKIAVWIGALMLASLANPALAQLHVNHARWGVAGANGRMDGPSCDARAQLARVCEGKEACQLPASNRSLCGDPAQGRVKKLEVSYACDGEDQIEVFAESSTVSLRCDHSGRDDRPRRREAMRVQSAIWGVMGASGRVDGPRCDASRELARACNGERACEIPVDNRALCGDPAPEREKTLEISYSCGGDSQTLSFPEASTADLRCEMLDEPFRRGRGDGLNISSARWGRASEHGRAREPACNASAALANACNGKSQCQVSAYNRYLCGDPVPGEVKVLEVSYSCGRRQETLSFPETTQAVLRCPQRDAWRRDDDRR